VGKAEGGGKDGGWAYRWLSWRYWRLSWSPQDGGGRTSWSVIKIEAAWEGDGWNFRSRARPNFGTLINAPGEQELALGGQHSLYLQ
jgi:hypothetical protein